MKRLHLSLIASAAIMLAIAMNAANPTSSNAPPRPQSPSPIEVADRSSTMWFFAYVLSLLAVAGLQYLAWRAGNKVQDAIKADADARIEAAHGVARDADARAAEAGREAASANEAAAKANERAQQLEAENLVVRGKVAGLERQASDARARAAEAERLLAEVNERTKDRRIGPEQRWALRLFLADAPKGTIRVSASGEELETKRFAKNIVESLRHAGWTVVDSTDDIHMLTPTPSGLLLRARSFSSPITMALFRAFSNIGFELSRWQEGEDLDETHFSLMVCPR